jgi:hypothetical protein
MILKKIKYIYIKHMNRIFNPVEFNNLTYEYTAGIKDSTSLRKKIKGKEKQRALFHALRQRDIERGRAVVWYPCSFIVLAIRENYSIIKDKKCFARFEFFLIINSLLRLSFLAITSCIYVLWGHHDYLKKGKLICSNSRKLILSSWMG